jgi:hypothetical protein
MAVGDPRALAAARQRRHHAGALGRRDGHRSRPVTVVDVKLYTRPTRPPLLLGAALSAEAAFWPGGWTDALITVAGSRDGMHRSSTRSGSRVPLRERTAFCWYGYLMDVGPGQRYGYRVDGRWDPAAGARFDDSSFAMVAPGRDHRSRVERRGPRARDRDRFRPAPRDIQVRQVRRAQRTGERRCERSLRPRPLEGRDRIARATHGEQMHALRAAA